MIIEALKIENLEYTFQSMILTRCECVNNVFDTFFNTKEVLLKFKWIKHKCFKH